MNESNYMFGKVTILLKDRDGEIVRRRRVENTIVNSGRLLMAKLFAGIAGAKFVSHMALGEGTDPTTSDMTGLGSEITSISSEPSRSQLIAEVTDQGDDSKATVSAVFPGNRFMEEDTAELSISEAGLFTEATDGDMYNRVTFPPIPLRKSFELTLIWEITFPMTA